MDEDSSTRQILIRDDIPLVLVCEGKADDCFFRKIIDERRLQSFNVIPANGFEGIERALKGIRADPAGFVKMRGVLIAADSRDEPNATFDKVATMVRRAGYAVPEAPLEVTNETPRMAVMLIPGPTRVGSLETLCVDAIIGDRAWLRDCIDAFLGCGELDALNWTPEKLSKARFCALVAATFRHDPSRATSLAFSANEKRGVPQMISTRARCFDEIGGWLGEFSLRALQ
jgi:hypothetical protein